MKERMEIIAEDFAVRIVNMCEYLKAHGKGGSMVSQVYRAGTSIGANINEARHAQSTADFISKMSIALKEAKESHYWLSVMTRTNILTQKQGESMLADAAELRNKLAAIVRTTKRNNGLL